MVWFYTELEIMQPINSYLATDNAGRGWNGELLWWQESPRQAEVLLDLFGNHRFKKSEGVRETWIKPT